MAGKPGMPPDLMLAAGQKVALNERIMSAPAKDVKAGLARGHPTRAFGMETASCVLRQRPVPETPVIFRVRCGDISVQEGDVALPDFPGFELRGKVGERFAPAAQQDDPARFPIEPMDGMKSEAGVTVDFVPMGRGIFDRGLKNGTKIPFLLLLDAESGGLFHHEPALARCEDRDGVGVGCRHRKSVDFRVATSQFRCPKLLCFHYKAI